MIFIASHRYQNIMTSIDTGMDLGVRLEWFGHETGWFGNETGVVWA